MSLNLKLAAKEIINSAIDYRYHRFCVSQANRLLNGIEDSIGKTPSRDIKLSDQYAVEILGHKHFAPWLYVYSAISGGFKEGWMPDNFYGSTVVPVFKGGYGKVSSLKPLNSTFFGRGFFPDIASFVNGIFIDKANNLVASKDIKDLIFKDHNRVVFKLDNSSQGAGIYFLTRDTFSVEKARSRGNGLFQGFIQQHKLFNDFAENSVATLRVTTVFRDDGEVSVRACYLRLGSGEDTHVQTQSHVRVPINLKSGAFDDKGYLTSWLTTAVHPTSKVPFAGNFVPAFSSCVATVIDLHKKVPYVRCIGWDVTVDIDENVKVMEWNAAHNDIKFSEATQGPCFSDLGWEKLKARQVSLF